MREMGTITINDNLITKQKKKDFWENYLFVAMVLGIVLLMLVFFRRTQVVGHSMDTSFFDGQNLICQVAENNNTVTIDNGDVVVVDSDIFQGYIIKRVIGTPGDSIAIKNNILFLNGVPMEESYVNGDMLTADIPKFVLGENEYFVMGDNRNKSTDSRAVGPFTVDEIFGKVVFDLHNMAAIEVPEEFAQFRD